MPTADQIDPLTEKYSFLFKGGVGMGKTLAAATFASLGPIYLAYIDKKSPIELTKFFRDIIKRPELLKNIEYDVYSAENINKYLEKIYAFTKYCDKVAFITDGLTTLTASAVNWSLGHRNPQGPKKDSVNPAALATLPDWDEYKVETSLVTQALDNCRKLPCHIIWTAHPLPKMTITEGGGASGTGMKIVKTNSLVTYGSKVAGLVPGQFSEIYHFGQDSSWDGQAGRQRVKYIVDIQAQGDEFAKTSLNLPDELDITNGNFYEIWSGSLKRNLPKL